MADLLVRYGATPSPPVLDEQEKFVDACFRLDRDDVRAHLEKHPEYLQSPAAIFAAARKDRADVVAFLLDLGAPIDVQDRQNQRALHVAAGDKALGAATLLVDRGAEIDPRDSIYNATPLGYAVHYQHHPMIQLLSRVSRDVWNLAFTGNVERLQEVVSAQPERAKAVSKDGTTPLWWLPDDEATALEIVELFLAHGADPSIRSKEGNTAADWALKRGMITVAERLIMDRTPEPPPARAPGRG